MRKTIIINNQTYIWKKIIKKAEQTCGLTIEEDVAIFLVNLLMRFIDISNDTKQSFTKTAYLCQNGHRSFFSDHDIASAADGCLFYLGLFPNRLAKFDMSPEHVITSGKLLYQQINHHPFYTEKDISGAFIAEHYNQMIDILLTIRDDIWHNDPIPEAFMYQLWQATGSKYAYHYLNQQQ